MNSQLGIRTEINVNNEKAFKLENKYISINENNLNDKYENGKVVEKDFKNYFYYSSKVAGEYYDYGRVNKILVNRKYIEVCQLKYWCINKEKTCNIAAEKDNNDKNEKKAFETIISTQLRLKTEINVNNEKAFELENEYIGIHQNNLGDKYENCEDVKKDFYYFIKTGENGNEFAPYNLSECYDDGIGVSLSECYDYRIGVNKILVNKSFNLYKNGDTKFIQQFKYCCINKENVSNIAAKGDNNTKGKKAFELIYYYFIVGASKILVELFNIYISGCIGICQLKYCCIKQEKLCNIATEKDNNKNERKSCEPIIDTQFRFKTENNLNDKYENEKHVYYFSKGADECYDHRRVNKILVNISEYIEFFKFKYWCINKEKECNIAAGKDDNDKNEKITSKPIINTIQLGLRTEINVNNEKEFKLENKYISINENNLSDKYENGKVVEKGFKKNDFYYSSKGADECYDYRRVNKILANTSEYIEFFKFKYWCINKEKECNIAAGKDNNDENEKIAYKPIMNTTQLGLRTEINVNNEKAIESENEYNIDDIIHNNLDIQ
ncbi:hypothetical protein C1645_739726 [Glomus cerebriforme]|uniref:Uncharacterized protein n=1 Tax=Glomus cerebriforme TaxID=658196 RepID=A0A397SYX1_9GLOM|nr:hypothetical protein C1645_739726 [Glomus cerebriforme]